MDKKRGIKNVAVSIVFKILILLGTLLVGAVTHATGSVNLGAIPIACLLAAGIVVFLIAAKVNRPFLAQRAAQAEQENVQAERTAVYRGGHGKRVRRKRTDDTGRPCFVGSVRANQAHAKL